MALLLISQEVKSDQDRIGLANFLKNRLATQLKAVKLLDDLADKLHKYTNNVEESEFVKTALNELINEIK